MNSHSRTKVLFIITKADVGGAQKYINDLATHLDKTRYISIRLYGGKDIRWLSNKTRPWFLFFNDWLAMIELVLLYRQHRPDLVHLNSSKASVLGSFAAFIYNTLSGHPKLKVVFTAHGWVFNPTDAWPSFIRWGFQILHRFAAPFQDQIICVSRYDYDLAIQKHIAPPHKLVVINNGIDPHIHFLKRETAREVLMKKIQTTSFKIKKGAPWIGSIGRLVREKNYETLFAAAQYFPEANWIVIGDGPDQAKLEKLNQTLKHKVILLHASGEDYLFLKAFDVFAMSSIKEGFPYILLEAMAAQLPIVVTEAGGMPEMIAHHQKGLVVAQRNPERLTQAIKGILAHQGIARELKRAEQDAIKTHFNLATMVARTEAVYSSIASN